MGQYTRSIIDPGFYIAATIATIIAAKIADETGVYGSAPRALADFVSGVGYRTDRAVLAQ